MKAISKLKTFAIVASLSSLILVFQNCGDGQFQAKLSSSLELDSLDLDPGRLESDVNGTSEENTAEEIAASLNATTSGESYYATKKGSDSNSCAAARNPTTAKKTLSSALDCLVSGDTLWIGNGVYSEFLKGKIPEGASESQRTTIRALSRRKVVIQPPNTGEAANALWIVSRPFVAVIGIVVDGRNLIGGSALKIEYSPSILLEDIETRYSKGQGILVHYSPKGILRNSRSHHNGDHKLDHGMYLSTNSDDWLIEKNEFDNNSSMGIQIYTTPKRTVFRQNFLHDNCQKLIGNISGSELFVAHQDQIIENNRILVRTCVTGIAVNYQYPARSKIKNNSVYCGGTTCLNGIHVQDLPVDTIVEGNIVLGFPKNIRDDGQRTLLINNITSGDPDKYWVSPATGDLTRLGGN